MEYESIDNEIVPIHILNDNCLRHVFQFLPISDKIRAERVCKRWEAVSLDSWHTMKVLNFSSSKWGSVNMDRIAFTFCNLLPRCGRFLTRLDLSELYQWWQLKLELTKDRLNTIVQFCPNLTDVDLSGVVTHGPDIYRLTKNFKNITRFTLKGAYDLDNDDFFSIHKNIEYLNISHSHISCKSLTFLSSESMHTLILYYCYHIHDHYLSAALQRLRGLEKLVIKGCTGIKKSTLKTISRSCINLKTLHLYQLDYLTVNNSLNFTNLVKLENISITCDLGISDDYITNMALNCRELIDIDIAGCNNVNDTGLASIGRLPKLEKLNINFIWRITDESLRHIRNLREFECQRCNFTAEGLSMMLTSSPELRLLNISECFNVNKQHILKVANEVCNTRASNVILKLVVGRPSFDSVFSTMNDNCSSDIDVSPFLQIVDNICKT